MFIICSLKFVSQGVCLRLKAVLVFYETEFVVYNYVKIKRVKTFLLFCTIGAGRKQNFQFSLTFTALCRLLRCSVYFSMCLTTVQRYCAACDAVSACV